MFPIYCKVCGEVLAQTEDAQAAELTKDKLVCGECVPLPDEVAEEDEDDEDEDEEKEN